MEKKSKIHEKNTVSTFPELLNNDLKLVNYMPPLFSMGKLEICLNPLSLTLKCLIWAELGLHNLCLGFPTLAWNITGDLGWYLGRQRRTQWRS